MGLCLALGAFAPPADAAELPKLQLDHRASWEEPMLYSAQVMGLGITTLVALDLHDADPSFENFLAAWRSPAPRPDDDGPVFNYVLHPLWGSETYLRARSSDISAASSLGFSMGASITWEYLIESWTEHPSSQDLVFTTGLGWMLGEARYQLLRSAPADDRQRKWLDPLYLTMRHLNIGTTLVSQDEPSPRLLVSWSI